MNESKARELRKLMRTNKTELLIILRNHLGERTEGMNDRQVYQNLKKLFGKKQVQLCKTQKRG